MNKDQVKGAIKDAAGKLQEKTGKLIGSTDQKVKGIAKQVEGKAQKAVGNAKEVLKGAGRKSLPPHRDQQGLGRCAGRRGTRRRNSVND